MRFDETEERENLIDSKDPSIAASREFMRAKLTKFLREEALYGLGELRDKFLGILGKKRGSDEEVSNTSYRNSWEGVDSMKKARTQLKKELRKQRKAGKMGAKKDETTSSFVDSVNYGARKQHMDSKDTIKRTSKTEQVIKTKTRMEFDHGTR